MQLRTTQSSVGGGVSGDGAALGGLKSPVLVRAGRDPMTHAGRQRLG
jgi:hypothetical protein